VTTRKSHPSTGYPIPIANDIELPFKPTIRAAELSDHAESGRPRAKRATLAQVDSDYAAPKKPSPANVVADPSANLQTFTLADLAQFTNEKVYFNDASKDVHLFFVGRDDVHNILKYILSRASISLYLNMFDALGKSNQIMRRSQRLFFGALPEEHLHAGTNCNHK
jgi:hypothetical protein